MTKFLFKNLKEGATFGVNERPLCLHVITYLKRNDDDLIFFDSTDASVIVLNKDNFVRGLATESTAPYSKKAPVFEFIEILPKNVFDVVKANSIFKNPKHIKIDYPSKNRTGT